MNLSDLIAQIEAEFPEFRWLLRDGGHYRDKTKGEYMAHIFDENERDPISLDFARSYVCYAATPAAAVLGALQFAQAARKPA